MVTFVVLRHKLSINVSGANLMTLAFNSPSNVTSLAGGYLGQQVTFFIEAGRQTFVHGANLVMNGQPHGSLQLIAHSPL